VLELVKKLHDCIIDFHSHFYPPEYLCELRKSKGEVEVIAQPNGDYVVSYWGDRNLVSARHIDPDYRLQVLDQAGITHQVLSIMTPGVHFGTRDQGVYLARIVNDAYADMISRSGGRFMALAALPLQDPEAAAMELERAVLNLGLQGGLVFTNINGRTLDDPRFLCLYETARKLDVPLLIHPTTPQPPDAYLDYRLVANLGFPFDTTIAVARLIFSGMLDRVPGLKIIAPHLGGCLPFLGERLDRGHKVFPECRGMQRKPSEYIKTLYFDCVHFDSAVVDFVIKYAGIDRILVGSDYPAQIGDIDRCTRVIEELDLTPQEKQRILSGNALRLAGSRAGLPGMTGG
jgi:aminocarboxymuconate-semialdehyde decarboxylase